MIKHIATTYKRGNLLTDELIAAKLICALLDDTLSTTELYGVFTNNIEKRALDGVVNRLIVEKRVTVDKVKTLGRPKTVFTVTDNEKSRLAKLDGIKAMKRELIRVKHMWNFIKKDINNSYKRLTNSIGSDVARAITSEDLEKHTDSLKRLAELNTTMGRVLLNHRNISLSDYSFRDGMEVSQ